jgi:predicted nucleotide-binding protein
MNVASEERLANNLGWCLKFTGGEIVNVYDTGKVVPQGRRIKEVTALLGLAAATPLAPAVPSSRQSVFVVYGHDRPTRDALEAMLRRWNLEPLIMEELPSEGATVIEKLERTIQQGIHYAVVLATPDDEGHPAGQSNLRRFRARQNVVLELGMLLAKLGRSKVAILLKRIEGMEKPSDIEGLIYLGFTHSLDEIKLDLAREMRQQGITLDVGRL